MFRVLHAVNLADALTFYNELSSNVLSRKWHEKCPAFFVHLTLKKLAASKMPHTKNHQQSNYTRPTA